MQRDPLSLSSGGKAKKSKVTIYKTCFYCRRRLERRDCTDPSDRELLPTVEHRRTQSSGGLHDFDNLASACARCNGLRGDLSRAIFDPFARNIVRRWPNHPTAVLRDALMQYIVTLAEQAARSKTETRKALVVTALQLGEQMKGD